MKTEETVKAFLVEVTLYALLVIGYFFLVLHFLGGWLTGLFHNHRTYYAFISLGLIVAQGMLLETLTTALLKLVRTKVR